jgi:hypothetical protein
VRELCSGCHGHYLEWPCDWAWCLATSVPPTVSGSAGAQAGPYYNLFPPMVDIQVKLHRTAKLATI